MEFLSEYELREPQKTALLRGLFSPSLQPIEEQNQNTYQSIDEARVEKERTASNREQLEDIIIILLPCWSIICMINLIHHHRKPASSNKTSEAVVCVCVCVLVVRHFPTSC